ncbi:MAG: class I SAM-dependent methyltransferase [Anaerolineaceae bacterium]
MDTTTVYSIKAEKYAKYRWDYALNAIDAIADITKLSSTSTIADIGAGTGILTRHFTNMVQRIYAIEPNVEMREMLVKELGTCSTVSVVDGCAENTKLANSSVDVITVAHAIHWFDPEPARREMMRILTDGGWLVLVRNFNLENEQERVIGSLMTEEYGADFTVVKEQPQNKPSCFYFGNGTFQNLTFPFQFNQSYEEFIGALTTASFMPDEDHPLFKKLETKAREVFSQYSKNGYMLVEGKTELIIGQPSR